jgi:spore maturation protein CgeB
VRLALFSHSLLSCWNHGNAHFLRGLVGELVARGHEVRCFEPRDAWSVENLVAEAGEGALDDARRRFPALDIHRYDLQPLLDKNRYALDAALDGVDLVLVHEWNDPRLVSAIGRWRAAHLEARALFHDTHHRAITAPTEMARYDLSRYDGVLAFGRVLAELYTARRWARRAFVFHEAADTRLFRPLVPPPDADRGDLVWIGNWGDDERTRELEELLLRPVAALGLRAVVHGVRYPDAARAALAAAGISYRGWVANARVPELFAAHRVTIHVPRRPYAEALPGIPTIRVFEALACGIPLVSAPWRDTEELFRPGDYLVARDGDEMTRHLRTLLADDADARALAARGLESLRARHTCGHRADQLLGIARELSD